MGTTLREIVTGREIAEALRQEGSFKESRADKGPRKEMRCWVKSLRAEPAGLMGLGGDF